MNPLLKLSPAELDREFVKFILEQDDNRDVNMSANYSWEDCGCLMVHFGKEKLGLKKFGCGMSGFDVKDWGEPGSVNLYLVCNNIVNRFLSNTYIKYSKVKAYIRETYPDLVKELGF